MNDILNYYLRQKILKMPGDHIKNPGDPWHYARHDDVNVWQPGKSFIEECYNRLSLNRKVIEVGSTGYPKNHGNILDERGMFQDEVGRLFVVTPRWFVFQRYCQGTGLMYTRRSQPSYWNQANETKLNKIRTDLFN